MLNTILGTKIKMDQAFEEDRRISTTLIKAGPCVVTQVKTLKNDGYWGVQVGFGEKRTTKLTKPEKGHLKGLKITKKAPRFLREIRFNSEPKKNDGGEVKVGDVIDLSQIFTKGDLVRVTGVSKGKGFAGVVKRWRFSGGPKTHGQGTKYRGPGSIGQGTTPGRVYKGKKMAGRMGGERVTVKNLKVLGVDLERNELKVSGPVPGIPNGLLVIEKIK
ncbi:MAG: 50S ribosomal protein L3 [Candidatus Woesebacteria bacterium GW2011_GWB1_43_14]|uniref:Large ribosomal subunit protein uL3 n=1 Tax=Candidatus Woesebacteria bacterium GW2011_GWB1_43_14 TaxID=1618578 RepID=A0A0G1DIA1_9BACT|nr:MAG: 50S ribosomal protein L3 [Candidatus Woesebacteria bacterium GW2011_GWA1_39_11b]KKS78016.1 MAG: 50S ribosomal protein L3 [Candidatus Woesebacteria bacterium GW2011_GWC1_42_9]KKS97404.1 MAG: 50S ribosomal protein L3 [Candidatus Woesebacteria bacterium GW2011_GWB1_43_14]